MTSFFQIHGETGRTRGRLLLPISLFKIFLLTRRAAGHDADLFAAARLLRIARVAPALDAFDAGVGDARRDEADRADRVVVARDHVIDEIRIAVGVGDRDDRDV